MEHVATSRAEGRRPRPTASRGPVVTVVLFFAVAATLVLIGAERSREPPPQITIEAPGTAGSPRVATVIMRDYRFDPTPLVLVAGETVRLTVFDAGLVAHELTLGDDSVQQAWAQANALATPPGPLMTAPPARVPAPVGGLHLVVPSGGQATVSYTVPETGGLQLVCHLPGHVERGMVGRVEVRAKHECCG